MPRTILITGAAKSDCLRIRNVLRRGFRQSVIHVSEGSDLFAPGAAVVAAVHTGSVFSDQSTELKEKARRAEFLLEMARILSSAKHLDHALWTVVEKSKDVLGDAAFVFLLDGAEPELRCAASTQPDQLPVILESLVNFKSQVKAKLQEVFQRDEAVLIGNVSLLDLPQELMKLVHQFGFMSLMAIPIKKDSEIHGVFVTITSSPQLFEETQLIVSVELAQLMARAISHAKLIAQLEEKANTDGLTGLYNRRFFDEVLRREAARAERHRLPLALLMLDVDDFKLVNDHHGHTTGDNALKALSNILLSSVRREDFVFRHGGDEFGIVLPDTGVHGGMHVAEHIRARVEAADIAPALGLKITVSIGVSEYEVSSKDPEAMEVTAKGRSLYESLRDMVDRADKALYQAKSDRKNRVEVFRTAGAAENP